MITASNVPLWGTVAIAIVAGASGTLGVLVQSWSAGRSEEQSRRRSAYFRLINASEIIALRFAASSSQRSWRYTFASSLLDVSKAAAVGFLLFMSSVSKRFTLAHVRLLADSIQPVSSAKEVVAPDLALKSLEELLSARAEVHLHGTKRAVKACDELVAKCQAFVKVLDKYVGFRTSFMTSPEVLKCRDDLHQARENFLSTVRAELGD